MTLGRTTAFEHNELMFIEICSIHAYPCTQPVCWWTRLIKASVVKFKRIIAADVEHRGLLYEEIISSSFS